MLVYKYNSKNFKMLYTLKHYIVKHFEILKDLLL